MVATYTPSSKAVWLIDPAPSQNALGYGLASGRCLDGSLKRGLADTTRAACRGVRAVSKRRRVRLPIPTKVADPPSLREQYLTPEKAAYQHNSRIGDR